MSAIVVVHDWANRWPTGNLNMRQLLNPLFYSRDVRHPDRKRQRKARIKARALRQARELKAMAVPLRAVMPPERPVGYWMNGDHRFGWSEMTRFYARRGGSIWSS